MTEGAGERTGAADGDDISGLEIERAMEGLVGAGPIPVVLHCDPSRGGVGFAEVGIERQGPLYRLARGPEAILDGDVSGIGLTDARLAEPDPCRGISGVELDRLAKETGRGYQIFLI